MLENLSLPPSNFPTALSQYFKVRHAESKVQDVFFSQIFQKKVVNIYFCLQNYRKEIIILLFCTKLIFQSNTIFRYSLHLLVCQVAFQHQKPVELEKAENLKDGTDVQKYVLQERSGNPYYKIGFPLITGRLDEDKVKLI